MVSEDFNLLSQKNVSMFLKSFHDSEQFSLSGGASSLSWVKLPTAECNWLATLQDHCSQLVMACIRVDLERLQEIQMG